MKDIQAFPGKQKALMIKSEHLDIASEYEIEHNGMTLRDYFATHAMQAIFNWSTNLEGDLMFDEVAEDSYLLADSMLKARESNKQE